MVTPVQITARDFKLTPSVDNLIRERAAHLTHFYPRINSCRVVLTFAQKHKNQGKLYNARIDVTVPRKEFAATKNYHEDLYVAIRQAFDAVEKQLAEHAEKRNGHVKTHTDVAHGHVSRLVTKEGYGFIEGHDGQEYYFSVTNVHHPHFKQLCIGDAVEYIVATSGDGHQAQHVVRERHQHSNELVF